MFEEAYFQNDDAAREHLEALRWPDGPVCPHCGCIGNITKTKASRRAGLYTCNDCRKQFTVTIGTLFERSHIPLHKWFQAFFLLCSSKKGMSSHQLHRMLGVTYKTAWFMTHRIREAMNNDGATLPPMGGFGHTVEVDETYWQNIPGESAPKGGYRNKNKIVSLVERNGDVRSFHMERVTGATLRPVLRAQIHEMSRVVTDEAGYYAKLDWDFFQHRHVNHKRGEYAREDIHTNTVEGYFAVLKRGLDGTYQHVGTNHLSAYLSEFDFRYNHRDVSDLERTMAALQGIAGKRLYYALPN